MATTKSVKISDLNLDLANFRTTHQANEKHAINALIAIHPDWFWALMESLLEDGYIPIENIIVLKEGELLKVKEGNRRIASLKLIHGLVKSVDLPDNIRNKIDDLPKGWKKKNKTVPCVVYPFKESASVNRLVSRIHGKGESSGRDKWTSVARARFARDENQKPEPGLDLLEKYLKSGKNLTSAQGERWAGDYPLTVLDEAIKKLAPLIGFKTGNDLALGYPKTNKSLLDKILLDIGRSHLGFKELRAETSFWGDEYGIQSTKPEDGSSSSTGSEIPSPTGPKGRGRGATPASNDPRSVQKILRQFKVRGEGREKIATLIDEIKKLRLEVHPHAFCFLLRSIFELSAKAYCKDHKKSGGPSPKKSNGEDKSLANLLRDITKHLTNNNKDKDKLKKIHGAMTELGKSNGILSVTSMNQLIHNPSFSIAPPDICILFGNLFPLLEEMNG